MKRTFAAIAMASLLFAGCREQKVENVIYLIGDGMGIGPISQLILFEKEPTAFEGDFVIGLSETRSANNFVTDSPAGGTALATGTRTNNGYLGVDPDGVQLTSLMKKAQALGKKSGIVVNTTLTEATPASFYAGVKSRETAYVIAEQFVESGVDIAIGAGIDPFVSRPDSIDLTERLIDMGYDVYVDWPSVMATDSKKFVGILSMADVHRKNKSKNFPAGAAEGAKICTAARMAADADENFAENIESNEPKQYLEKAVAKALEKLSAEKGKGFFLMIESAIIDGYGHNNDSDGMLEEMQEFNATLKVVKEFAKSHPNTLLVVTADHETGGVGVRYKVSPEGARDTVGVLFSTKGHTGTFVPVFAYGPGAELFSGIQKNVDIAHKIEELMNR